MDLPAQSSDTDGTQVRASIFFLAEKQRLEKSLWTKPHLNNWCMRLPWLPLPPPPKFGTENLFNYFEKKRLMKTIKESLWGNFRA